MATKTIDTIDEMEEQEQQQIKNDIEMVDVTISLGGETIHKDLTFSVRQGEFLGVIGPNGAGKTTFLRLLLGLLKPERGIIKIQGRPLQGKGSAAFGYVPQARLIDPEMPLKAWDFVSFGLKKNNLKPWLTKKEREKVKEVFHLVDAVAYIHKPIGRLSGGERQRLYLAQALLADPKYLLLDEPTSALDPGSQQRIVELVNHVRHQLGISVVFISHDINIITRYADRILYLTKENYTIGKPEEVLTSDVLTRLYNMPTEVVQVGDKIIVSTAQSKEDTSICQHQENI